MFCAAMIAAALVSDDPRAVVQAGLDQIPARSRLAEAIRKTLAHAAELGYAATRFEEMIDWLWREFGSYHPIHTINNAAAVAAAVLLAGSDFEKAITIAVMCGWDTDCNGATAGCIAGALRGAEALPAKWIAPLSDALRVGVQGYNPEKISVVAQRHAAVAEKLLKP
jgi:ADP-ribosylglycohydrolase